MVIRATQQNKQPFEFISCSLFNTSLTIRGGQTTRPLKEPSLMKWIRTSEYFL